MSSTAFAKDRYGRALHRTEAIDGRRDSAVFRRVWSAVARTGDAFAERIAEARRMARACEELATMSEPELRDIGINRADIPALGFGLAARHVPLIPPQAAGKKRSPSLDRNDQPGDQGAST